METEPTRRIAQLIAINEAGEWARSHGVIPCIDAAHIRRASDVLAAVDGDVSIAEKVVVSLNVVPLRAKA